MQKNNVNCLLIDDDVDDRNFFVMATKSLNFDVEVAVAGSGAEAFEMLEAGQTKPDCIFLDLNMPKMNGREFLKKIKNTQGLMEIPVLIYTTSSDAKDKTDLILLGANKVITKPNSIPDLVLILKKELGKM